MGNWAEEYGETVETRSEYRERRRKLSAQERAVRKAMIERDFLFKEWRKWHEEQLNRFLEGDYADAARELHAFLSDADLDSGDRLIELVKRGPWREADEETQFQVLRMIDRAITYLRERNSLEPFSDPLPFSDEELNVFLKIRNFLA